VDGPGVWPGGERARCLRREHGDGARQRRRGRLERASQYERSANEPLHVDDHGGHDDHQHHYHHRDERIGDVDELQLGELRHGQLQLGKLQQLGELQLGKLQQLGELQLGKLQRGQLQRGELQLEAVELDS
jgi:hypothetical protein